jgi:hypothetical protein
LAVTFEKISRRILLYFKVRSVVVSRYRADNRLWTRVEGSSLSENLCVGHILESKDGSD